MTEYLRSVRITADTPEPVIHTVLLTNVLDWGVAFRRSSDGRWYTAGPSASVGWLWPDVAGAMEGADCFLLGPEHRFLDVKMTA